MQSCVCVWGGGGLCVCPDISRTKEEFYTVRCTVSDMKNLYVSVRACGGMRAGVCACVGGGMRVSAHLPD